MASTFLVNRCSTTPKTKSMSIKNVTILASLGFFLSIVACDDGEDADRQFAFEAPTRGDAPSQLTDDPGDLTVRDIVEGRFPAPMISAELAGPEDEECPQSLAAAAGNLDQLTPQREVEIDGNDARLLSAALTETCVLLDGERSSLVICNDHDPSTLTEGEQVIPLDHRLSQSFDLTSEPDPDAGLCWFCAVRPFWCSGAPTWHGGGTINNDTQCLAFPTGCC